MKALIKDGYAVWYYETHRKKPEIVTDGDIVTVGNYSLLDEIEPGYTVYRDNGASIGNIPERFLIVLIPPDL